MPNLKKVTLYPDTNIVISVESAINRILDYPKDIFWKKKYPNEYTIIDEFFKGAGKDFDRSAIPLAQKNYSIMWKFIHENFEQLKNIWTPKEAEYLKIFSHDYSQGGLVLEEKNIEIHGIKISRIPAFEYFNNGSFKVSKLLIGGRSVALTANKNLKIFQGVSQIVIDDSLLKSGILPADIPAKGSTTPGQALKQTITQYVKTVEKTGEAAGDNMPITKAQYQIIKNAKTQSGHPVKDKDGNPVNLLAHKYKTVQTEANKVIDNLKAIRNLANKVNVSPVKPTALLSTSSKLIPDATMLKPDEIVPAFIGLYTQKDQRGNAEIFDCGDGVLLFDVSKDAKKMTKDSEPIENVLWTDNTAMFQELLDSPVMLSTFLGQDLKIQFGNMPYIDFKTPLLFKSSIRDNFKDQTKQDAQKIKTALDDKVIVDEEQGSSPVKRQLEQVLEFETPEKKQS